MINVTRYLPALAALSIGAAVAVTAPAQTSAPIIAPNILNTLDTGLWQFRNIGGGPSGAAVDQLCISDMKKLAQVQHNRFDCEQKLLRANMATALISYSCAGHGNGLTTIRRESDQIIQISSQGINDGAPFSFNVEARRMGSCPR